MTTLTDFTDGEFPEQVAATERINAFEKPDGYAFKHYFDGSDVFSGVGTFYNDDEYRFEVPRFAFPGVVDFLSRHGYEVNIVDADAIEEYTVAVEKYTSHAPRIRRRAVLRWNETAYNYFVLTDQAEVEWAVMDDALRVTDVDLQVPGSG